MFRNSYQSGFLSVLYSVGSQPLSIWDRRVENGHIKRIADEDVKSQVVEIAGTNVATTFIFCPQDPKVSLGVKLKFLVLIIKNLNKYFSFEITVLDNTHVRRRLRASNYQSTTRVRPFSCSMPMSLNPGWNQVQFNLADFTKRAYGTEYLETTRIQIHANCRIRRVYFADKLYTEDDVPPDYRLYVNDDPRTARRFSEQPTAMTSAALTSAAMAGCPYRPINCSGAIAAPPTPCGGDIATEETPLPDEKMKSFLGVPPLGSTEVLPSHQNVAGLSPGRQPSKPHSFASAGFKPPSVVTTFASGSNPPSTFTDGSKHFGLTTPDSMVPMAGSRAPSNATSIYQPPSLSGGSNQPSFTAGSKPPSVLAASSEVPEFGQQPSLTAAAPASVEVVGSLTDGEPLE